ncbi:hypothetical protein B0H13DRAFT_1850235 [Mycena leptocephala]|nr:hypothetical protein B0H13DRAFT_1850235 [Mycena leptocephala]
MTQQTSSRPIFSPPSRTLDLSLFIFWGDDLGLPWSKTAPQAANFGGITAKKKKFFRLVLVCLHSGSKYIPDTDTPEARLSRPKIEHRSRARFAVPLDFFLHQDWNITPIGKELRTDLRSEETADNCLRKMHQYLTHFGAATDIRLSHYLNAAIKLPPPQDMTVHGLNHIVGYNADASSPFVQRGYLFALYGLVILGFYPCFFPPDIPHPARSSFEPGSADSDVALSEACPPTGTETAVDTAPAVSAVVLNFQNDVASTSQLRDHLAAVFLMPHKS